MPEVFERWMQRIRKRVDRLINNSNSNRRVPGDNNNDDEEDSDDSGDNRRSDAMSPLEAGEYDGTCEEATMCLLKNSLNPIQNCQLDIGMAIGESPFQPNATIRKKTPMTMSWWLTQKVMGSASDSKRLSKAF